jgi:hypothetical protein
MRNSTLTSSLLPGLLGGLSMTQGSGGSAASMMPRLQAVTWTHTGTAGETSAWGRKATAVGADAWYMYV